jgi:hypothetical protein
LASEWDDEQQHEAHSEMLAKLAARVYEERHGTLVDINEPEHVEIEIHHDGTVIWIHVDGITRLRACRIKHPVVINDHRLKGNV